MIAMVKPVFSKIGGEIHGKDKIRTINICLRRFLRMMEKGFVEKLRIRIEFEGLLRSIVKEINSEDDIVNIIIYLHSYFLMKEEGIIENITAIIEYIDKTPSCSFCHDFHHHSVPFIRKIS